MTSLGRHSRLTYYDLGPTFLTQGVELLPGEVWQVSKRNSQHFRSYLRKTTGGALWPPPSGARVKDPTGIPTFHAAAARETGAQGKLKQHIQSHLMHQAPLTLHIPFRSATSAATFRVYSAHE